MSALVRMDDYKLPAGGWDFTAYREAQRRNGETCSNRNCNGFILFPLGHPEKCPECRYLDSDEGERAHGQLIRCPRCRHQENAYDTDLDLYSEGEHVVCCSKCDHEFEVSTAVSYTFTSPPIQKSEEVRS